MSEHPIDDIFREGLEKFRAPVPEGLWAKVAAERAVVRRRLAYRRMALGLSAVLIAVVVAWLSWPEDVSPLATASPAPKTELPRENFDGTESRASTEQKAQPEITAASIPSESGDLDLPATDGSTTVTALATESRVASPAITEQKNDNVEVFTPLPAIAESAEVAFPTNRETVDSGVSENSPETINRSLLEQRPLDAILSLPLPRLAPYYRPLPQPTPVAGGFKRAARKRLDVDILGGFAYAHQQFKLNDEIHREARNAREVSEFPGLSFLAGVRVSRELNRHFSLRSGVLYTQVRNQFEYEQQTQVGVDSVQSLLIRSSNRIRMLEIPLLLGYELPGKRFSLSVNAGPVLNLHTQARGRYLLPTQRTPVLLEEDNIYRDNVGLSWQASLTASYSLGQGNSLLIEPTFKSYPRSFTRPDYGLRENYWLAGLQVGLRHRLR